MLAALLTAYAEMIGDVIVNDAGQPIPRVLRYHGHAVPDDIECSQGILSAWWEPSLTPSEPGRPCLGFPSVILDARYVICWKAAQYSQSSVRLWDDEWDAAAAILAEVAEWVSRALMRLSCDPGPSSEFADRIRELTRSREFVGAQPTGPLGSVAGVLWRTRFGLGQQTAVS